MDGVFGRGVALGPRIPSALQAREAATMPTRTLGSFASRIMGRAAEETCAQANLCEKPVGGQTMTIAIALGVCIPLVSVVCVLLYLHRRSVQRQKREDMEDPHKSLDFGLGDNPGATAGKSKRKSFLNREKGDQARFQRQQMSMDMNLSSPYLLPPTMHNSRESLHSLARSLGNEREDPYRPVAAYAGSDAGSIRSVPRGPADRSSQYTRSSSRQGGPRGLGSPQSPQGEFKPPPRQNSLPKSNLSSPEPVYMKPEGSISEPASPPSTVPRNEQFVATPYPGDNNIGTAIPEPPAAAQQVTRKTIHSPSQPSPADSGVGVGYENPFEGKHEREESDVLPQHTIAGLGLVDTPEAGKMSTRTSTSSADSSVLNSFPQRGPAVTATAPIIEEPSDYYDYPFAQDQSEPRDHHGLQAADEGRGRTMQRQSQLYEQQQETRKSGLGVPQGDTRRLSVGFRPLPPDEIMESEDPEYRANRIRSFYKEYFEDTKPSDMPPVPPMPAQHQNRGPQRNNNQHQSNNYYEDYSENYGQDQPYFDPSTNSFVMPYAQPVARRAMTPPPSGQRFPGPRGPPRGFHGSMGGNNMRMPGLRGPPRPGSSVSNQRGPSRPGSAASSAWGRPRAGSAYSGSHYGGPKKPVPPPADLTTLPTPAMLKDDSFALLNAMDFAPPENFQSRARGRSQSPMGERRPYKPAVPVHSPLVNAFEELPSLPSPHLLRKSTTFTALDFAPPRKFVESDNRSETGSIRSNKSGISAVQLGAIRNGAGRVSRLPGDTIFTQQAMQDKLKPSWNMRD